MMAVILYKRTLMRSSFPIADYCRAKSYTIVGTMCVYSTITKRHIGRIHDLKADVVVTPNLSHLFDCRVANVLELLNQINAAIELTEHSIILDRHTLRELLRYHNGRIAIHRSRGRPRIHIGSGLDLVERVGLRAASEMLGVSVDTLRRRISEKSIRTRRSC